MRQIKRPTSSFLKVRCPQCKNEQHVFSKASTKVACLVCDTPLAAPAASPAKILGTEA